MRKWTTRLAPMLALAALLSPPASLAQTGQAATSPPKPYRERLLDRAMQGDAEAQFDLAKNYEAGRIGLRKDLIQAEHWYREAAVQGEPYAQLSLGILFHFGKGVSKDFVQAYMWYELAISRTSGGDRESIEELRDNVARQMTPERIAEAHRLARDWRPAAKR